LSLHLLIPLENRLNLLLAYDCLLNELTGVNTPPCEMRKSSSDKAVTERSMHLSFQSRRLLLIRI